MDRDLQELIEALASFNATHAPGYLAVAHTAADNITGGGYDLPSEVAAQLAAADRTVATSGGTKPAAPSMWVWAGAAALGFLLFGKKR